MFLREKNMKKSIKGLVLGLLATLAAFALVYAKPMVAQAGSYSDSGTEEIELYDLEDNYLGDVDVDYSLYFSWTGNVSDVYGCDWWGYLYNNGCLHICCWVEFDDDELNASGSCSYNISCEGNTYTGISSLVNWDGDDYIWFEVDLYPFDDSATGYYKSINDLKGMISNITKDSTLTGENRVIEFAEGTALPKDVIAAMATSNNVTLKYTFVYDGFEFCTTITSDAAKEVFNSEIGWYGPCFLAENFPTVWTGKTV